ncbi:MAG: metallophosphoesterase [candidate division KSB1 bacterium]|nr:metallophosphoesterase [candidate division KSB1 bacterium]MDZ7334955.1 metallophosphoesterase [candidate division KSB1 bacterium]MDZ7401727.1 metallophosphoesterase [candidate division KSB1 bacterium]
MRSRLFWRFAWLVFIAHLITGQLYSQQWSFIGVADTHSGDGFPTMLQWASTNLSDPAPAFLIHAGDQEPMDRTEQIVTKYFNKPFYPSTGNHDKDADRKHFYESYFKNHRLPNLVDSSYIAGYGPEALFYSFIYENCYFIVLDQYYHVPYRNYGRVIDQQLQWLEDQLKYNSYPFVFVIGHEPAYPQSWQRNYGDCLDRSPEDRDRFWEILAQYQVTAYLCGHTHSYLKQYIQKVWQINLAQCGEYDHHMSIAYFIADNDSIRLQIFGSDGQPRDDFCLAPRNVAHPVELTLFSFELIANQVKLIWETASERNNYGFEIEQSLDKLTFHPIGFIPGKGTTQVAQRYEFHVHDLVPGRYYYRLKQLDLSGGFSYSKILEVAINPLTHFQLPQNYPNPFHRSTTIGYHLDQDGEVALEIYNCRGQLVNRLIAGNQSSGFYEVNWNGTTDQGNDLPSGIYFGRLSFHRKQLTFKMLLHRR